MIANKMAKLLTDATPTVYWMSPAMFNALKVILIWSATYRG